MAISTLIDGIIAAAGGGDTIITDINDPDAAALTYTDAALQINASVAGLQATINPALAPGAITAGSAALIISIAHARADYLNPNTTSQSLGADYLEIAGDFALITGAVATMVPGPEGEATAFIAEVAGDSAILASIALNHSGAIENGITYAASQVSAFGSSILSSVFSAVENNVGSFSAGLSGALSAASGLIPGPGSALGSASGLGGAAGSYLQAAIGALSTAFQDPLLLDVSGRGLNVESIQQAGTSFDYTGNFAQKTSWIGSGTGFLVQVGSDGLVDNGSNFITNFQQLGGLDTNHDGVISGAELNGISVWQDANGDGVCQPGEVVSLASLDVVSISLKTNVVSQSIAGDIISQTAIATMADGTTRGVAAVELNTSNVYTTYVGPYTLTPDIQALPDLKGYGVLPNLRVAMSQNGTLETAVQNLTQINPSSTAAYDSALQVVLYQWAGVQDVSPQSGGLSDGQKLGFLQSLINNHSTFLGNPVPWIID